MIIEIHQPETEALIAERMATGAFECIEDLLLHSLEASPVPLSPDGAGLPKAKPEKQNLSDFLLNSPLHGSGLVVERIRDASTLEPARPDAGQQTGRALIDAMQSMPYNNIDIEPARFHMPVRDVVL